MTVRLCSALMALALLLAATSPGCSSEKVIRRLTTFKADSAFTGAGFRQFAVLVDTGNLQWRYNLETRLVQTLREDKFNVSESYAIISPTRAWSEAEWLETLVGKGFDGYLHLTVNVGEVREHMVPPTSTTTIKRERTQKEEPKKELPMALLGLAKPLLDQAVGSSEKRASKAVEKEEITTETRGGYTVVSGRTQYIIRLVDIKNGNVVWMGLNEINGDPNARLPGFCEEIAKQLLHDLPDLVL